METRRLRKRRKRRRKSIKERNRKGKVGEGRKRRKENEEETDKNEGQCEWRKERRGALKFMAGKRMQRGRNLDKFQSSPLMKKYSLMKSLHKRMNS